MGVLDKARQKKIYSKLIRGRKKENYDRKISEYRRNKENYVLNVYRSIYCKFSKEKRFVESLLKQVKERGDLSAKQWLILDEIKNRSQIKYK